MDIRQLRHFLAVAQTGSFSKAGILLGVAQPMLSRQVRSLEDEVGIELVYRNGRGAVLTEAGQLLARQAESILHAIDDTSSALKAMKATPSGEIVLGLPPMIGTVLTVPVVDRFRAAYPGVNLRIIEAFSGYVLEWLSSGRLDVAVVFNVAHKSPLALEPLIEEDFHLVASPALPLEIEGKTIRMSDLDRVPLILPNSPHGLRALVDASLARFGKKPNVALEVDGLSAMLRLVEHGTGATILSRTGVDHLVGEGRLVTWPIVEPTMTGRLDLATSTQRPTTFVTRALARIVRAEVHALVSCGRWIPHRDAAA